MDSQKPLSFKASALDYFVFSIVSIVLVYIPFLGWAYLLNYSGEWFATRTLVTGKKVVYQAGYGESLKFIFINVLLLAITFGIYSFWFYPKLYSYLVDHTSFDGAASMPSAPLPVAPPADPVAPVAPAV